MILLSRTVYDISMTSQLTPLARSRNRHTLAKASAATFVAALMVVGVPLSASASTPIDVAYGHIIFDNPDTDPGNNDSDDIGNDAQLNDFFDYENVFPGVDARVTVLEITNLEGEVDKVDEGQDTTDPNSDDTPLWVEIDPPGSNGELATGGPGSAKLRIDFFDSASGFTTPVTLTNFAITVKDIDSRQFVTFYGVSSYFVSSDPASVLVVTEDGSNVTFAETLAESSNGDEEQHWAVVRYASASSVTFVVGSQEGNDAEFGVDFNQPDWTVDPTEVVLGEPEQPEQSALANTGQNDDVLLWGALGVMLAAAGAIAAGISVRRSRM
jgi:hypothetical protein